MSMTLQRPDRRCYLCAAAAVEPHHLILRSQGGADGPTIELCRPCHDHFTQEKWELRLDADGIWIVDKATGEIIFRRLLGVDGREAFDSLHLAREALECVPQFIPFLDNEQLVVLFRELRDVGKRGWAAQCAIIAEAITYRFVRGTKIERAKALAADLGVSVPTLYDYAGAWLTFGERLGQLVEAFDGRTSYIVEAARHENADELIDEAVEEFQAQAGAYPLAAFRAHIKGEAYEPRKCPWLGEGAVCERYQGARQGAVAAPTSISGLRDWNARLELDK